jgi:hypothetical protein
MLDLATLKTYLTSLGVLASTRKPKRILIFMIQDLPKEQWASVKNIFLKDLYMVSNKGRIKSINNKNKKEKLINGIISEFGYRSVHLRNAKEKISKNYFVHRLVCETFLENVFNKPQVNHIDGNKLNNNLENLEWVTAKENTQHAYNTGLAKGRKGIDSNFSKISELQVLEIRKRRSLGETQESISKDYNINANAVSLIVLGKNWKHLPILSNERVNADRKNGKAPSCKLKKEQVIEIVTIHKSKTLLSVSKIYGVCFQSISNIRNGITWSSVTGIKKA